MKRWGNLLQQVYNINNIELADDNARKGKRNIGIINHDKQRREDNLKLSQQIKDLTYKTSRYTTFIIHEPKERVIFRLPYYPDRILHHAIMNVMEDKWVNWMVPNSYSCIKNRGIHKLNKDLSRDLLKDPEGTKYCLKLDIHKFYPSIDHDILKDTLRIKIKDEKFMTLLNEIIDSSEGVPIGNYLSQFFANLYLTPFDYWLLRDLKIKYYYRYCDDMVILASTKQELHYKFKLIREYLDNKLKLQLKNNYQVFEVDKRGIDFVGYRFFRTHIKLRKNIKMKCSKLEYKYAHNLMDYKTFKLKMSSYFGWLKYCNSKHFLKILEDVTKQHFSNWKGIDSNISKFLFKNVHYVELAKHSKYFKVHFIYKNKSYSVNSTSKKLYNILNKQKQTNCILIYGKKNYKVRRTA